MMQILNPRLTRLSEETRQRGRDENLVLSDPLKNHFVRGAGSPSWLPYRVCRDTRDSGKDLVSI